MCSVCVCPHLTKGPPCLLFLPTSTPPKFHTNASTHGPFSQSRVGSPTEFGPLGLLLLDIIQWHTHLKVMNCIVEQHPNDIFENILQNWPWVSSIYFHPSHIIEVGWAFAMKSSKPMRAWVSHNGFLKLLGLPGLLLASLLDLIQNNDVL